MENSTDRLMAIIFPTAWGLFNLVTAIHDAAFEQEFQIETRAIACGSDHLAHADRVHAGYCYECQIWL